MRRPDACPIDPRDDEAVQRAAERIVERFVASIEAGARASLGDLCSGDRLLRRLVALRVRRLRRHGLLGKRRARRPLPRVPGYVVFEEIGRGSTGVVLLAEQRQPIRRRVAVKILRLGVGSRDSLARFELEQRALARLQHPSIARVLDTGRTEDGRPFFAMELVRGAPITTFCARERADLRTRLELFAQVCDAVQHAHQRGVVHRDLKPSNLLVEQCQGTLRAKVIDFGVAKLLSCEREGTANGRTTVDAVVGTLAYMSPEQIRDPASVDARSDVFALGVVLYELLTGRRPARPRAGEWPQPPSRHAPSRRERRAMRGDLDAVVVSALAPQPEQRTATPGQIAADCRRYLAGEPVLARHPGRMRELARLARRYPLRAAAVAMGVLGTLAGASASAVSWARVLAAEQRVRTYREQARRADRCAQEARARELQARRREFEAEARLRAAFGELRRRSLAGSRVLDFFGGVQRLAARRPRAPLVDVLEVAARQVSSFARSRGGRGEEDVRGNGGRRVETSIRTVLGFWFARLGRFETGQDQLWKACHGAASGASTAAGALRVMEGRVRALLADARAALGPRHPAWPWILRGIGHYLAECARESEPAYGPVLRDLASMYFEASRAHAALRVGGPP